MTQDDSFDDLMSRLGAHDERAAAELFGRFSTRLVCLARARLGPRLRQTIDPEDVLQSALRSFFVQQRNGDVAARNWDSLWGLLAVMTIRKCSRQVQRHRAARRDIRRNQPIVVGDDSVPNWDFIVREPLPEEQAALAELFERLLADLNPRELEIFNCYLDGQSPDQIAVQVHRSQRTVERVLEKIRERLESFDT